MLLDWSVHLSTARKGDLLELPHMPKTKSGEAQYYEPVADWLKKERRVSDCSTNVAKSSLWSVDVLGGKDGRATVACELKRLAFPNGAAGAGAIGQAIALKVFVPQVYVVLVVGNRLGLKDCNWQEPKPNQLNMAKVLGIAWPQPGRFEDYRTYLKLLFEIQFGETGLGLLLVDADRKNEVEQVVDAKPGHPCLDQPTQWLSALGYNGKLE